jgi:hypothetical protein
MDLTGKRTKSDGDPSPSDPEIDPATRRELEDRISELSKENAVLEKVTLIASILTPMELDCDHLPSIIAFQPGPSQYRTRRRVQQDSFSQFGRVANRVRSTVDGTRSFCWLGGPSPRRVTGEGRLSPGERQRSGKTPSRGGQVGFSC